MTSWVVLRKRIHENSDLLNACTFLLTPQTLIDQFETIPYEQEGMPYVKHFRRKKPFHPNDATIISMVVLRGVKDMIKRSIAAVTWAFKNNQRA